MRFLLVALAAFGLYRLLRRRRDKATAPPRVTYTIVEHDGGWAYQVDDVFSETFRTRAEAVAAAEAAASAHANPGGDVFIEYQDRRGRWHTEMEPGRARPQTYVDQKPDGGV